jgi:hypothetical protein
MFLAWKRIAIHTEIKHVKLDIFPLLELSHINPLEQMSPFPVHLSLGSTGSLNAVTSLVTSQDYCEDEV